MSPALATQDFDAPAPLFAALGDPTRLKLVMRLSHTGPQSISVLATDAAISRQAITKHLQVLEQAGLAASRREGRERVFELRTRQLAVVHDYLDRIDRQWDKALARLKAQVEKQPPW